MSILDRLKAVAKNPGALARTWSEAPRSETTRLPALFHQSPRLDPVELIASTIAGAPMELFDRAKLRKDGDNAEPLFDHQFYQLIDNPSKMFPELDGYAVKFVTVVLVELLGECFWLKVRAGNKVVEILPFPPAWCIRTPTASDATFLFQPFGTTAGRTIEVDAADVVWFKQPSMTDPYGRGRGRTEATGDELDSDEMIAKWQKNYFYNDATPPIWVNLPGAQPADLARMRDTWGQRLGGWLNARKPAFTNSESMSITKLGDSLREMDFVESRKYLRDVFLQHYAIPPEMFGIIESSNRSTIDAAYYLFAKNVIKKRLGFYERAITRQMIATDYDDRLELRIQFDVPEDETFKLQVVNEGIARGTLTRADWKKAMGYKIDPADDVYLMPYSIVEVPRSEQKEDEESTLEIADAVPENVAATALNGAQVASLLSIAQSVAGGLLPYETALEILLAAYPTITQEDAARMLKPLIIFEPTLEITDEPTVDVEDDEPKPTENEKAIKSTDPRKSAHWKSFDSKARENEGAFRAAVRKFADAQAKRVTRSIKDDPKGYKRGIKSAFDGADEALMHALAPAWLGAMTDGAHIGRGYLGLKATPSFDLYNKAFDAWVKKQGLKKAIEINTTTYEKLLHDLDAELAAGIAAGESIPNLATRMLDATAGVYENMSEFRATLIARTESIASVNFAQRVVYEEEGIEKVEWLATQDGDTRDSHIVMDGKTVAVGESFDVPGYQASENSYVEGDSMEYPGGGTVAGQNCNCRCTILPVIER